MSRKAIGPSGAVMVFLDFFREIREKEDEEVKRKTVRKIAAVIALLCLGAVVLTGCGGSSTARGSLFMWEKPYLIAALIP